MKVKELIKLLKKVDPERIVIMSSDAEGNKHSPLADIDDNMNYVPDNTWSGEIGLEKLTPKLIEAGYSDADVREGEKACVLYPTN